MAKKRVLLAFGGESSEHQISILSAKNVFLSINKDIFDISLCYIDEMGSWWLIDDISDNFKDSLSQKIVPILGESKLLNLSNSRIINIDVILPILHGINGEDGTIQGLAKLMHTPIVGCSVASSAIAMDKVLTKQILEANDIKTVPYTVHLIDEVCPIYSDLSSKLSSRLFIKPANGGSSVGVSVVSDQRQLVDALNLAHQFCNKVLIETAIVARELEVGMLQDGDELKVSRVGEIKADREFYDFDSKYDEKSQSADVIPAAIDEVVSENIRQIAKKAFIAIDGSGISRVDFFLQQDGTLFLNEINTIPGFTNISMYPKLWQDSGVSYADLIEKMINSAK